MKKRIKVVTKRQDGIRVTKAHNDLQELLKKMLTGEVIEFDYSTRKILAQQLKQERCALDLIMQEITKSKTPNPALFYALKEIDSASYQMVDNKGVRYVFYKMYIGEDCIFIEGCDGRGCYFCRKYSSKPGSVEELYCDSHEIAGRWHQTEVDFTQYKTVNVRIYGDNGYWLNAVAAYINRDENGFYGNEPDGDFMSKFDGSGVFMLQNYKMVSYDGKTTLVPLLF